MYQNPYASCDFKQHFLRTSFHTHAGTGPNTCGSLPIEEVLGEYQRLDYDAICLSNHNLYTNPAPYQNRFGLCLPRGYEYTVDLTHMVCVGTEKVVLDSQQHAIDSAVVDGGFAILCHPHWKRDWGLPKETIDGLRGFVGMEIYNGSIDCGKILDEAHCNGRCHAPDVYDYLLSGGRLCWCFGNDDFHRWWYLAIAWNMIFADKTETSIIDAVKKGRFYVSTGLLLEYLTLQDNVISLSVRNNEGYRDTYRYRFIGQGGEVLQETVSQAASYHMRGDELYVRVEVSSPSGKMLYTQPVYDDTRLRPTFTL